MRSFFFLNGQERHFLNFSQLWIFFSVLDRPLSCSCIFSTRKVDKYDRKSKCWVKFWISERIMFCHFRATKEKALTVLTKARQVLQIMRGEKYRCPRAELLSKTNGDFFPTFLVFFSSLCCWYIMSFMEDLKFKNAELLIERIIDLQLYFEENEKIKTDLRLRILMQIFKKKMIFA